MLLSQSSPRHFYNEDEFAELRESDANPLGPEARFDGQGMREISECLDAARSILKVESDVEIMAAACSLLVTVLREREQDEAEEVAFFNPGKGTLRQIEVKIGGKAWGRISTNSKSCPE
jgi:alkylation response protein AidB-like acyl-CoA dehydrogenase